MTRELIVRITEAADSADRAITEKGGRVVVHVMNETNVPVEVKTLVTGDLVDGKPFYDRLELSWVPARALYPMPENPRHIDPRDADLILLSLRAVNRGEESLVDLCQRALDGNVAAREEAERALEDEEFVYVSRQKPRTFQVQLMRAASKQACPETLFGTVPCGGAAGHPLPHECFQLGLRWKTEKPFCVDCGDRATCFGLYDGFSAPDYSCDNCCAHTCERFHGYCTPVMRLWPEAGIAQLERFTLVRGAPPGMDIPSDRADYPADGYVMTPIYPDTDEKMAEFLFRAPKPPEET